MSKRIKVTGYIDPSDWMDDDDIDLKHVTGLSEQGFDKLTSVFAENPIKVSDLQDVDTEVVDT